MANSLIFSWGTWGDVLRHMLTTRQLRHTMMRWMVMISQIMKEQAHVECEKLLLEFRSKGFSDQPDAITKNVEKISPRLLELEKAYLKGIIWINELKKG